MELGLPGGGQEKRQCGGIDIENYFDIDMNMNGKLYNNLDEREEYFMLTVTVEEVVYTIYGSITTSSRFIHHDPLSLTTSSVVLC